MNPRFLDDSNVATDDQNQPENPASDQPITEAPATEEQAKSAS